MRKIRLVCVVWQDAETSPGWFHHDPKEKICPVKSYGLLVARDKDAVTLASTFDPETGKWCDKIKIPTGMVKSVKTIASVDP